MGLEIAQNLTLDLILLDINLPNMDDYEMFRNLKEMPHLSAGKIIAVSANAMEKDVQKALLPGFDEYITKPIDLPTFIEKIKRLLYAQGA